MALKKRYHSVSWRKVKIRVKKRGKKLTRYAHFNTALVLGKKLKTIRVKDEFHQQTDNVLANLLRYSPARCVEILRLWLTVSKIDISPFRLKSFDEFHHRCGGFAQSTNITKRNGKMNLLLRREKPRYRLKEPCYRYEGNHKFVITAETYRVVTSGVCGALDRLRFDPVRDFEENTIGLTGAIWRINQLTDKDSPE